MKTPRFNLLASLAVATAVSFGLAGCGGSSEAPEPPPPPPPHACEAGPSQACVDARQAELDALGDNATVAEQRAAMNALNAAQMALDDMNAAAARKTLVDAAMCSAATQACLDDHNALVEALEADLAALRASDGATNAQEQAAQMALDEAETARDAVQMALADVNRDTATGMAVTAAETAADMLESDRSAEAIMAAEQAIAAAKTAIEGGDDPDAYMSEIEAAETAVMRAKERNAVDEAVMMARTAVEGLTSDADGDAVAAVQALLDAATTAVDENDHLMESEETAYTHTLTLLQTTVTQAQARVDDDAEKQRMAEEEAEKKANEAMAATAAKLYEGIAAQTANASATVAAGTVLAAGQRAAAYNNADVPSGNTPVTPIDTRIMVGIGTTAVAALTEDKKTMVTANHGWEGKRYTRTMPASEGMYEAVVYSNVEPPEMGRKFGSAATVTATGAYEYELDADDRDGNANKALTIVPATHAAQVSLSGVTRTAGTETFKLPDPNPSGADFVTVPGMLHGVSGVYSCAPSTGTDCIATVAPKGFTLEGGTWLFIPSNAEARVMDAEDEDYASYGWWLHKTENGKTFTASAFHDFKGSAGTVDIANLMGGTATYRGGAAGKYALSSSTGGTNDAGHFTARATLQADFEDDTITGTIDHFMGADGMARDWSVELKEAAVANDGAITRTATGQDDNDTVWTIGGTPATASGEWLGELREEGTDNVPKSASGTFYTEYGNAGKMVGGFGANKQ